MPTLNIGCSQNGFVDAFDPNSQYAAVDYHFNVVGGSNWPDGSPNQSQECRSWYGFNIYSNLPAGAIVTSATFNVYLYWTQNGGDYSDILLDLRASNTANWDESNLQWNGAPDGDLGSVFYTFDFPPDGGQFKVWKDVDVTVQVLSYVASGNTDKFSLRMESQDAAHWGAIFGGRTSVDTPYLTITYTLPVKSGALFFGSD